MIFLLAESLKWLLDELCIDVIVVLSKMHINNSGKGLFMLCGKVCVGVFFCLVATISLFAADDEVLSRGVKRKQSIAFILNSDESAHNSLFAAGNEVLSKRVKRKQSVASILNSDENAHYKSEIKECQWRRCNVNISDMSSQELKKHISLHAKWSKRDDLFCCDWIGCCKAYTRKGNLRWHVRVHHFLIPIFCEKCGGEYFSRTGLSRHRKACDFPNDIPFFLCDKCGVTFGSKAAFNQHKNKNCSVIKAACGLASMSSSKN